MLYAFFFFFHPVGFLSTFHDYSLSINVYPIQDKNRLGPKYSDSFGTVNIISDKEEEEETKLLIFHEAKNKRLF